MVGKSIILAIMLKSGMREGLQWKGCLLLLNKNPVERLSCWQEWAYPQVSSNDSRNGSWCQAELPCQVLSFCFSEKNENDKKEESSRKMGVISRLNISPTQWPVLISVKHLFELIFKINANKSYRNSIRNGILKLFTARTCT